MPSHRLLLVALLGCCGPFGGCQLFSTYIPEVKGEWKGTLLSVPMHSRDTGEFQVLALDIESGPGPQEDWVFRTQGVRIEGPVLLSQYEHSIPRPIPASGAERIGDVIEVRGRLRRLDLFLPERLKDASDTAVVYRAKTLGTQPATRPSEPDLVLVIRDNQLRRLQASR